MAVSSPQQQSSAIYSFARGVFPDATEPIASIVDENMKRQRLCYRCRALYMEYENIGAWRCAAHPLQWNPSRQLYPCCNTSTRGCLRCDHIESPDNAYPGCTRDINISGGLPAFPVMPENLPELQGVMASSILLSPNAGEKLLYVLRRQSPAIAQQNALAAAAAAAAATVVAAAPK